MFAMHKSIVQFEDDAKAELQSIDRNFQHMKWQSKSGGPAAYRLICGLEVSTCVRGKDSPPPPQREKCSFMQGSFCSAEE
jgi:hypothetical protein